ncbi:MAG TPA: TrmH family RNA methyltransferase, partial [Cryomorphaceae bacterium]|nr:TrmH family RNA methyltransferase [Cryomorphaceae bacterium]
MNTKTPNNRLGRLSANEFKEARKAPICLVLDNLRSAQNIGSVFRTMDAFRCEEVFLCGICAQPPHREINKTALGATESVAWTYRESARDAVLDLKNRGYKVYAVEQTFDSQYLNDVAFSNNQKVAFVLGNEVTGVDQNVIDACDGSIEI